MQECRHCGNWTDQYNSSSYYDRSLDSPEISPSRINIIMVYILGVLLSSYISDKKIYAVYSSCSVCLPLIFIYRTVLFSEGLRSKGYPTTFAMLFIVGLLQRPRQAEASGTKKV